MKISQSKSGPLGPDKFENDYGPMTAAERLTEYGKDEIAEQEKQTARLKALAAKVKKARGG